MDQDAARQALSGLASASSRFLLSAFVMIFLVIHVVVVIGMNDLRQCPASPYRLQFFSMLGPLLTPLIALILRAFFFRTGPGPAIAGWLYFLIFVGIDASHISARTSVQWSHELSRTGFCETARNWLPRP